MRLGIMQPYFFPYLGYFDLINCSDQWIVFDTVQYIQNGWINRNRILHPKKGWQYIIVPIKKHSYKIPILEVETTDPVIWRTRILGQLFHYHKKAPYYQKTINFVKECLETDERNLSKLNVRILSKVCSYLKLDFKYSLFSQMNLQLKPIEDSGDWALRICEALGATEYINPPKGTSLYDPQRFKDSGIKLIIQDPMDFSYSCKGYGFEPNLSVIDALMWNKPEDIKAHLDLRKKNLSQKIRRRNVLVLPAGTEIGLEIYRALQHCKEVNLFGAGQDVSNHARFAFPEYHVVPSIFESGWVESLEMLCRTLRIDYIFPAHDDVIIALSREAQRLPAKIITSPLRTCEITRSKSATYKALSGKVRVPELYASKEAVVKYPVILKPDSSQGSFGVTKADNEGALVKALQSMTNPIICEYLPGEEYTVDCFSDRDRGLLFCGARIRARTRNGISVNTRTVPLPEALEIANIIGKEFDLRGAWFFQLKRSADGKLVLLEIGPRIAGSMAANRVKGINFPLLSIFEEERLPIAVKPNEYNVELDRALENRYKHTIKYSSVYVDLDDTLLVNRKVNTQLIKLLFECINNGKKIILLTRHQGDLTQTLSKYHLSGLFHEIFHLEPDRKKSDFIKSKDAIFVDDSFSERMEVSENCNIPTFDSSIIEILQD